MTTKAKATNNAAENLSTANEVKPETTLKEVEGGKTEVTEVKEGAKGNAQKAFLASLTVDAAKKTLKEVPLTEEELAAREEGDTSTTKLVRIVSASQMTNEELVKLGEEAANEFTELAELEDKALRSSADLYAKYAPLFPIRKGVDGKADTLRFISQIFATVPDSRKTANPNKPGTFMKVTNAAKERNPIARGLTSMKRWIDRNHDELFPMFTKTKIKLNDDEKTAVKSVKEFKDVAAVLSDLIIEAEKSGEGAVNRFRFIPVNEDGTPATDENGDFITVDLADILVNIAETEITPEANAAKDHIKALKGANKKELEAADKAKGEEEVKAAE